MGEGVSGLWCAVTDEYPDIWRTDAIRLMWGEEDRQKERGRTRDTEAGGQERHTLSCQMAKRTTGWCKFNSSIKYRVLTGNCESFWIWKSSQAPCVFTQHLQLRLRLMHSSSLHGQNWKCVFLTCLGHRHFNVYWYGYSMLFLCVQGIKDFNQICLPPDDNLTNAEFEFREKRPC